jgi:hypothetical protein
MEYSFVKKTHLHLLTFVLLVIFFNLAVLGGLFTVSVHYVFCHIHALVDQVRIEEADFKNWGKRWAVLIVFECNCLACHEHAGAL